MCPGTRKLPRSTSRTKNRRSRSDSRSPIRPRSQSDQDYDLARLDSRRDEPRGSRHSQTRDEHTRKQEVSREDQGTRKQETSRENRHTRNKETSREDRHTRKDNQQNPHTDKGADLETFESIIQTFEKHLVHTLEAATLEGIQFRKNVQRYRFRRRHAAF